MLRVLPNILEIIENWDRWSKMVAAKLPDLMCGSIIFKNITSIRVLKWLVILVGCKIRGINELGERESKTSFVSLCVL